MRLQLLDNYSTMLTHDTATISRCTKDMNLFTPYRKSSTSLRTPYHIDSGFPHQVPAHDDLLLHFQWCWHWHIQFRTFFALNLSDIVIRKWNRPDQIETR